MPDQVGPGSPLVLVKSNSSEVWDEITNLLPDRNECLIDSE